VISLDLLGIYAEFLSIGLGLLLGWIVIRWLENTEKQKAFRHGPAVRVDGPDSVNGSQGF
jgi:hypothetical protein